MNLDQLEVMGPGAVMVLENRGRAVIHLPSTVQERAPRGQVGRIREVHRLVLGDAADRERTEEGRLHTAESWRALSLDPPANMDADERRKLKRANQRALNVPPPVVALSLYQWELLSDEVRRGVEGYIRNGQIQVRFESRPDFDPGPAGGPDGEPMEEAA